MSEYLSKDFTLEEMTFSQTAARNGIDNSVKPGSTVYLNLKRLCANILQPLRDSLGIGVTVSSGYRCPELNTLKKGAKKSQHVVGEAADIQVKGKTPKEVFEKILELKLPFDQMILEFNSWIHVSVAPDGKQPRKEMLAATSENGQTKYSPYITA